ncbi:NAD-dependent succinate-semialdehyde dehydrogenase [Candidatus Palauibacter sp.]|uniref:NAD-dependent succinate-semialdehyde dehydrogenase n=1 Tax=Candidatus Palauibacter sp. TaxID=3101350 RepID=UPI003B01AEFA
MPFESIDPTTEERLASFPALDAAGIDAALERARDAFEVWRRVPVAERAERLLVLAELVERGKAAYGLLMTREMGKPLASAVAEAEKCAWVCRYYAEHGAAHLAPERFESTGTHCWVEYHPLGAVLGIMPWNFPFWQAMRSAVPTVLAGNVFLLKHSPNVPQCAVALEGLFSRAGFPEGVLQNIFVEVEDIPRLLDDPIVQAASLTGSVAAGSALAAEAGRRIKTTVLELGGSDPFIVMESADLDRAVSTAVDARMWNNGQSCIAAKRMLVQSSIVDEFTERLVERVSALQVGDPKEAEVQIGPLARRDLRDAVAEQVEATVAAGARVATGGRAPDRHGWFYEPTVLTDIPDGSPATDDEIFGPVASIFPVADMDEAIELANATEFGLCSAIWTNDSEERARAVRDLEAGGVFINGMSASDPRVPFGGVKRSGYGRELGPHAIREFVNVKTVWVGD